MAPPSQPLSATCLTTPPVAKSGLVSRMRSGPLRLVAARASGRARRRRRGRRTRRSTRRSRASSRSCARVGGWQRLGLSSSPFINIVHVKPGIDQICGEFVRILGGCGCAVFGARTAAAAAAARALAAGRGVGRPLPRAAPWSTSRRPGSASVSARRRHGVVPFEYIGTDASDWGDGAVAGRSRIRRWTRAGRSGEVLSGVGRWFWTNWPDVRKGCASQRQVSLVSSLAVGGAALRRSQNYSFRAELEISELWKSRSSTTGFRKRWRPIGATGASSGVRATAFWPARASSAPRFLPHLWGLATIAPTRIFTEKVRHTDNDGEE